MNLTLGENGILRHAENAGQKYNETSIKETIENILADMQMEEIKNRSKLTLEKVAQNITSKDSNIIIEEYNEEDTELKGTYKINGNEYDFTINDKFEVKVKVSEKIVKIEEVIWENGKPKVKLSSNQTGTIEYKDSEGKWNPYDENTPLNNGDTLTVRVNTGNGTTKTETIQIKDKKPPTEFEIEIAQENIKAKTVIVNLKTKPEDNETGIKDYTYVIEENGNKREITNITTIPYTITNLIPETQYTIYVIAYDVAGNYRKSNPIIISTPEYIPPTASVGTSHSAYHNLDDQNGGYYYTWDEIAELAKIISEDNRAKVTYTTPEVTIVMEGKTYTIGAGDYKNVTYNGVAKRVRILGFNHDTLNNKLAYGDEKEHTYAGISFEFVDVLNEKTTMNSTMSQNANGGWGACVTRKNFLALQSTINKISINNNIKDVIKTYNTGYGGSSNSTCVDKLWPLACSEMRTNGFEGMSYGWCSTKEGEQYAYYRLVFGNSTAQYGISVFKKNISNKGGYWLRSPMSKFNSGFCYINDVGDMSFGFYDAGIYGVAPGFCI